MGSKNAIIRNGVAYTVNKSAKILNGEVYSRKHGAYKDPKTNNIYRVVRNALVAKNGRIYTKARQYSYVKLGGSSKKLTHTSEMMPPSSTPTATSISWLRKLSLLKTEKFSLLTIEPLSALASGSIPKTARLTSKEELFTLRKHLYTCRT